MSFQSCSAPNPWSYPPRFLPHPVQSAALVNKHFPSCCLESLPFSCAPVAAPRGSTCSLFPRCCVQFAPFERNFPRFFWRTEISRRSSLGRRLRRRGYMFVGMPNFSIGCVSPSRGFGSPPWVVIHTESISRSVPSNTPFCCMPILPPAPGVPFILCLLQAIAEERVPSWRLAECV